MASVPRPAGAGHCLWTQLAPPYPESTLPAQQRLADTSVREWVILQRRLGASKEDMPYIILPESKDSRSLYRDRGELVPQES